MADENPSVMIATWIDRLRAGDDEARTQLLNCTCERLRQLAHKMLKGFGRVRRWEETDDVMQNAMLRLYRSLADVQPADAVQFYRLAATSIRRELLDLAKHYYGPQGHGANYASLAGDAKGSSSRVNRLDPDAGEDLGQLDAWANFHEQVELLPEEEKETFDLLWYQQLSQAEAALLLQISDRTVKRRWAAARLKLQDALGGDSPES